MSLYGKYVNELLGRHIVEREHGFATYSFHVELNETQRCYIEEIYVDSDFRKTGLASSMADEIASIAKKRGCRWLLGSVRPLSNGATESMKAQLAYGFKLDSATENFILLKKEL